MGTQEHNVAEKGDRGDLDIYKLHKLMKNSRKQYCSTTMLRKHSTVLCSLVVIRLFLVHFSHGIKRNRASGRELFWSDSDERWKHGLHLDHHWDNLHIDRWQQCILFFLESLKVLTGFNWENIPHTFAIQFVFLSYSNLVNTPSWEIVFICKCFKS